MMFYVFLTQTLRCWICSHESTEVTCSRPVRKDRRERFKAATSVISTLENHIMTAFNGRDNSFARLEVALDASVVARSSIIASVVSTSSYSQTKIRALPTYLQHGAYLKALYLLARDISPSFAMKWCHEVAAQMKDDELHALIVSPQQLKQSVISYCRTAKVVDGKAARSRDRTHQSDSGSIAESDVETSDYNNSSSSSESSHAISSDGEEDTSDAEGASSSSDSDDDHSTVDEGSSSSVGSSDVYDESGTNDEEDGEEYEAEDNDDDDDDDDDDDEDDDDDDEEDDDDD
jgi:hypothetical protein